MAGKEEPPSLSIGTEVSAKYKGAFCEAKVKKVVKQVKVKVTLKNGNGNMVVSDDDIKGLCKIGTTVEVVRPGETSPEPILAIINKVTDQSTYTVVFDDGDENTLRRTQLCLKGEKHFVKSDTLDDLPLSHPEHFSTPVMKSGKRRHGSDSESGSEDSDDSDMSDDDSASQSSGRGQESRHLGYSGRLQELVGRVVCMEMEDRKRTGMWVPVLVVQPHVDETAQLKSKEHLLVKSFRDSKLFTVSRKDTKEFTRKLAMENEDKALKGAYEKALLYFDTKELPQNWDREELLGSDTEASESDSSDDEPNEEKDRFVAQLYKFMDDRGTPINKCPQVGNRDLNLYRLFRLVQNLGGYNRVTNQMKWAIVHQKMSLPSSVNATNQIKTAYNKYLYAFENFYRKLGNAMGTISRPSRSRHNTGRSIVSFRERDSPKSPRGKKKDEDDDAKTNQGDETVKLETKADTAAPKTPKPKAEKLSIRDESETESEGGRKTRTRGSDRSSDTSSVTGSKPVTREGTNRLKEEAAVLTVPGTPKSEDRRGTRSGKDTEDTTSEKSDREDMPNTRRKFTKRPSKATDDDDEKEDKDQDRRAVRKNRETKDTDSRASSEAREETDDDDSLKKEKRLRALKEREDVFEVGTKLKVKYGRGKNQKIYEAKVMELEESHGTATYLVHYAGWNNRYNEWIKRDRVVSTVEEPSKPSLTKASPTPVTKVVSSSIKTPPPTASSTKAPSTPSTQATSPNAKAAKLAAAAKAKAMMQMKKRGRPPLTPSTSTTKPDSPPPVKPEPEKPATAAPPAATKSKPPTPTVVSLPPPTEPSPVPQATLPQATPSKSVRPTRSTSVESNLATGLPPKGTRRTRRSSGVIDTDVVSREDSEDESSEGSSTSESEEDEDDRTKRTTRRAAALMASKTDLQEPSKSSAVTEDKAPEVKTEVKAETSIPVITPVAAEASVKVKDVTQSLRDANRAREVSSKVKEVAKFKEVASKLKEVASKVKEVNTKVKEVTSKIKEEVTKEEQSIRIEEQNREEEIEKEKTAAAKDDKSESPVKDRLEILVVGKPMIAAARGHGVEMTKTPLVELEKSNEEKPSVKKEGVLDVKAKDIEGDAVLEKKDTPSKGKGNKKKDASKAKEDHNEAVSIKQEDSVPAKTATTESSQLATNVTAPEPEKAPKKRGPKPKNAVASVPDSTKAEPEATPKKRGPKPKRKMEETVETEPEVQKPKKKVRRKKGEKEEAESSTKSEGDTEASCEKSPEDKLQKSAIEKYAFIEEEEKVSPSHSMAAPQLVSISPRPSTDTDLPLPQLSPAAPIGEDSKPQSSEHVMSPKPESVGDADDDGEDHKPTTSRSSICLMDNTPPDTPEGSPQQHAQVGASPSREDSHSTESEREANMEVETLMRSPLVPPPGGESPGPCDTSTISNGSGGSSGNAPGSESDEMAPSSAKRKTVEEDEEEEEEILEKPVPKRRKRGHKRTASEKGTKKATAIAKTTSTMSDSDEGTQASVCSSTKQTPASTVDVDNTGGHHVSKIDMSPQEGGSSSPSEPRRRVCKYNFLDMEDGKYLEGEDRINYLMSKIQDLRKIYMGLKSEVACIDRRRKRHKRKEREAAQQAAIAAAQAAVDAVASQSHVEVSHSTH